MKRDEDISLQRGAKLLLEGATLAMDHCPQCKMPIYILRDKTLYCATCDVKLVREKEPEQGNDPSSKDSNTEKKVKVAQSPIQEKIDSLAEQLKHETDPERMVELAETIKRLEKIRDS